MDPIDILEKVNSFYSNAFSQLITLTIAILGVSGVLLPLVIQYIQSRSFRIEKENINNQIDALVNKKMEEMRKEISDQFQKEKESLEALVDKKIDLLDQKTKQNLSNVKGSSFFLQGTANIANSFHENATYDFCIATQSFIGGNDEANGRRGLQTLIKECLPKLNSTSFESFYGLETTINDLVVILTEKNENGRYTDDITAIKRGVEIAKKNIPTSSTAAIG